MSVPHIYIITQHNVFLLFYFISGYLLYNYHGLVAGVVALGKCLAFPGNSEEGVYIGLQNPIWNVI